MPAPLEKDPIDLINAALDAEGFDADGEVAIEPDTDAPVDEVTTDTVETSEIVDPAIEAATDDTEVADPDAAAVAEAAAKVLNQDEFDLLCDELGFRAPKQGQKENKIPVSRVRARVKTALKKYADKFGAERGELTGKVTKADTELATFRRVDQAIAAGATDPAAARRYIEMLAAVHPAYKAFLAAGESVSAPAVPQALTDLGPKPGPDEKYPDGTVGFSPAQLEKRDEWLLASAEIRAYERNKKETDARLGPLESERKAAAALAEDRPRVAARIGAIRDQWGERFLAQERTELAQKGSSEIAQYQAAHPELSFEQVVTAVLLPKLRADRTAIKQEVIAEMNSKRKMAKPSLGQGTRTAVATGPKSSTDIINDILDKAGITE